MGSLLLLGSVVKRQQNNHQQKGSKKVLHFLVLFAIRLLQGEWKTLGEHIEKFHLLKWTAWKRGKPKIASVLKEEKK